MKKAVFSSEEALRVAWQTDRKTALLQLHQWNKNGDLVRIKRGVYAFSEQSPNTAQLLPLLYAPSYISLEYALHFYGLLPDVVFTITAVSPRGTRKFQTPFGAFAFHKIQPQLFWGYDPETLMGEREKVLLDYFYLKGEHLKANPQFWEEQRFQNLEEIDFEKAERYAQHFQSKKINSLLFSLKEFSHGTT